MDKKTNGNVSDKEFQEIVANMRKGFTDLGVVLNESTRSQNELLEGILDPRRDIDDECGYPKTHEIRVDDYSRLYNREAIANRVVEVLPKESWQINPEVFESEEVEDVTEFELAFENLSKGIKGPSWFKDVEGNQIWEFLLRIDILSGIGDYGILLLGISDNKAMQEPVVPSENNKLIFLRPLDRSKVDIIDIEHDETNPRFGQPLRYNVGFTDSDSLGLSRTQETIKESEVHWSRVIHVADNLMNDEIFGVPRLRPVYNRIYDLRKIYGADGETYWRNAVLKLFVETIPQLGANVELSSTQSEDMRDAMENMMNGLQQWMFLNGMNVKSIAPAVSDPTAHVNVHLEAICIKLGIPKRKFVGSERGELSSAQDELDWNKRLSLRQNDYITPHIIVPFTDRLIEIKVLPEPAEGYFVKWPDLNTLTNDEKATVGLKKTEALTKYVAGGGNAIVAPADYLTRFLDFSQEEAEAMLEATMDKLAEETEEANDNIAAGLNPDGTTIIEEPEKEVTLT